MCGAQDFLSTALCMPSVVRRMGTVRATRLANHDPVHEAHAGHDRPPVRGCPQNAHRSTCAASGVGVRSAEGCSPPASSLDALLAELTAAMLPEIIDPHPFGSPAVLLSDRTRSFATPPYGACALVLDGGRPPFTYVSLGTKCHPKMQQACHLTQNSPVLSGAWLCVAPRVSRTIGLAGVTTGQVLQRVAKLGAGGSVDRAKSLDRVAGGLEESGVAVANLYLDLPFRIIVVPC